MFCYNIVVFSNWQTSDRKSRPLKLHMSKAWQQEHGRHPTCDCSVGPLPALKSPYQTVKQIWAKSLQHGNRNQTKFKYHMRCRRQRMHVPQAGSVLCQDTNRYAPMCAVKISKQAKKAIPPRFRSTAAREQNVKTSYKIFAYLNTSV